MDTREFLDRVHAKTDHLVISTHRPDPSGQTPRGIFWNRGSFSYSDIDKAVAAISKWDAEPNTTVYFSIGSFAGHSFEKDGKTKWKRKQEYATKFRTLCLDLDIGDGKHDTQKEGWIALSAALSAIKMPMPLVVSSGKGLHAYWPLEEEIGVETWTMLSDALCAALLANDLTFDTSKIKDPSMVLRPVGTHHKKQTPWLDVKVMYDPADDFDVAFLTGILNPWIDLAPKKKAVGKLSSVADAILGSNNDVELSLVAASCHQISSIIASGGFTDAAGQQIEEPLWRATMGFASFTVDPEASIIAMAGDHPDFDMAARVEKMEGYSGTGPPTCKSFEQHCAAGCEQCPYKGNITSPAQLSAQTSVTVENEEGEALEIELPDSYVVKDNKIYKEIVEQVEADDGTMLESKSWKLITNYQMHITNTFKNHFDGKSQFTLAIKYPKDGWQEEDHDADVLTLAKMQGFLLHRQIFDGRSPAQMNNIKDFLMDYLSKVQAANQSGVDYQYFGWQDDNSFLCGKLVIGGPSGGIPRRLSGGAKRFDSIIGRKGSREGWVEAMKILNREDAKMLRMVMLLSMGSVLSRAAGNSTGLVSIYSHKTTTGKTLALYAINSMFGHPKELLMQHRDTANAMYKIRGILNQLPCTIDELTTIEPQKAVDMTYDFSSGVEKNSMTQTRDLRDPVRWTGPTFVTTNVSLTQQFDIVQSNDSALRARCLEIVHDDRRLVQKGEDGISPSDRFFDDISANYGWAYPELVDAVIKSGGDAKLWHGNRDKFHQKFGRVFKEVDKYAEPMIISGWMMCKVAKHLGLISFDEDQAVLDLIAHLKDTHAQADSQRSDALDIIGQFLSEQNDKTLVFTADMGSASKENLVQGRQTEIANVRIKVVQDGDKICKGSYIAINQKALKAWLGRQKDGLSRVTNELSEMGALLNPRERVTMYKGCPGRNPGQAYCIVVDLTHQRYIDGLAGTEAIKHSKILEAILGGPTNAVEEA